MEALPAGSGVSVEVLPAGSGVSMEALPAGRILRVKGSAVTKEKINLGFDVRL